MTDTTTDANRDRAHSRHQRTPPDRTPHDRTLPDSAANHTVTRDPAPQDSVPQDSVPLWHLYVLRIGYLVFGGGLAVVKWPMLFQRDQWTLTQSVIDCMLIALSMLALLGLRYPLQMLPILLFESGRHGPRSRAGGPRRRSRAAVPGF